MTDAETRMRAAYTALADTRSLAETIRRIDLHGLGTDTIMAIGFMLGAIDKAKALVGRDIDDEVRRAARDSSPALSEPAQPEESGTAGAIAAESFHAATQRLFAAIKAHDRAG